MGAIKPLKPSVYTTFDSIASVYIYTKNFNFDESFPELHKLTASLAHRALQLDMNSVWALAWHGQGSSSTPSTAKYKLQRK